MFVNSRRFTSALSVLPLVSIDLLIFRTSRRQLEVLLGLRRNRPAQRRWFTPGGRIRKGESFEDAVRRVATSELGISEEVGSPLKFVAVTDHFYRNSAYSQTTSTHYVNLCFASHLTVSEQSLLNLTVDQTAQHSSWRWFPVKGIEHVTGVHRYVKKMIYLSKAVR